MSTSHENENKNNSNNNNNKSHQQANDVSSAYATALLRSLHSSGVQFLRYCTVDACNNMRCKAKLVDQLLSNGNVTLNNQVSIAEVCHAGIPYYADTMVEGTGLTATNVLILQPDLSSFRILPYAKKSAIVMGNSIDQFTNEPSPLCTRSLLGRVVRKAREQHKIAFSVGVELEFCLVDAKTGNFVDNSVFANAVTLNDREEFLSDLYDQLKQQYIPIELIHAESGPGQLEVVLEHSDDVVALVDNVVLAKETISAVARAHGCRALFLPKYDSAKAGNGMHVHVSIKDATTGEPLFCDGNSLAPKGASFVEGLLEHLPAILGLTMPTVNSFRRVGPGCWTGSEVGWALEDKEVAIRVCSNLATKEWDHVECKLVDASCNLYLGLAALLHSGLDGISRRLELRLPLSEGAATTDGSPSPSISTIAAPLPTSLEEALDALEQDETITQHLMGPRLSQGYLALRRNEAQRSSNMTLEDEVKEALARS